MDHHARKWPSELNDYVVDIPMKIAASYSPRVFNFDLPTIDKPNLDRYRYGFNAEKEAITMANNFQQQKGKDVERLRQLNESHQQRLQEQESNSISSTNGPVDLKNVDDPSTSINNSSALLASNAISNPAKLPSPVGPYAPAPLTSPVKELSGVLGNTIAPKLSESLPYPSKAHLDGPMVATSNDFSKTSFYNQFAEPYIIRNHSVQHTHSSGTINSSVTDDISSSIGTQTYQDPSLAILRPIPSQFNCDHKNNPRQEFIPMNRIDPADFESSSSSPFDDALLKAIDDKQELNRVFQHL